MEATLAHVRNALKRATEKLKRLEAKLEGMGYCRGCHKHKADEDESFPKYCGWCNKKIYDALGVVNDYNTSRGR